MIELKVEIAGETYTGFNTLELQQSWNTHHPFKLSALPGELGKAEHVHLDDFRHIVGSKIGISLSDGESRFDYEGIVTKVSCGGQGFPEVILEGYATTVLLEQREATRSYTDKSRTEIFREVTDALTSGNKLSVNANLGEDDPTIGYMTQYGESDWAFLRRLANDAGEWLYFDGRKLQFGLPGENEVVDIPPHTISRFHHSVGIEPLRSRSIAYDYVSDENHSVDNSNLRAPETDGMNSFALGKSEEIYSNPGVDPKREPVLTRDDLERLLSRNKGAEATRLASISGSSSFPGLQLGAVARIKTEMEENTIDQGSFRITSINHVFRQGGNYTNSFTGASAQAKTAPFDQTIFAPAAAPQYAKVIDNADPKGLGRCQVQFPWQARGTSTPWIPVMMTGAGKKRGHYQLPEKNDLVGVSFHHGHPDAPFVIGSIYHGDKKPEASWGGADNNHKVIATKGGNVITFNDTEGEEAIHIMNKDGKNEITLTLGESSGITISAQEKIELKAREILLNADDLSANVSRNLQLESGSCKISSSAGMEVSGGSTTKVKGGALVEVSASLIKLN